jgi:hypothetical protein
MQLILQRPSTHLEWALILRRASRDEIGRFDSAVFFDNLENLPVYNQILGDDVSGFEYTCCYDRTTDYQPAILEHANRVAVSIGLVLTIEGDCAN